MTRHAKTKTEVPSPPVPAPAATEGSAAPPAVLPGPAASEAGAAAAPGPEALELAQTRDRLLRLQADFDNFRKRTARDHDEWQRRATETVLLALLPVIDHLGLGLRHAIDQAVDDAHVTGLRLVADELQGVLRQFGVTPIEAVGKPFDPRWHEALAHLPSDTVPADAVIQETRPGYRIGEALLRPAQVLVSSGPAAEEETDPSDPSDRSDRADACEE